MALSATVMNWKIWKFFQRIQTGQPVSFKDQKSFLEELTYFHRGKHMEIIGNRY